MKPVTLRLCAAFYVIYGFKDALMRLSFTPNFVPLKKTLTAPSNKN